MILKEFGGLGEGEGRRHLERRRRGIFLTRVRKGKT